MLRANYYCIFVLPILQHLCISSDFEVTRVPVRSRTLSMFWIDRPDPSKGLVLDSAKVGRDLYAKLCYVPGTPFVRKETNL